MKLSASCFCHMGEKSVAQRLKWFSVVPQCCSFRAREWSRNKVQCCVLPKYEEALNFILSVLINAMPQRYAAIKYFPCSRLAFFAIFQSQTVAEINFPLFWCWVKHEIYFTARCERWEWKSSRFIRQPSLWKRMGNKVVVPPWNSIETTRSPMKITSRAQTFSFNEFPLFLSLRAFAVIERYCVAYTNNFRLNSLQERRFVVYALE